MVRLLRKDQARTRPHSTETETLTHTDEKRDLWTTTRAGARPQRPLTFAEACTSSHKTALSGRSSITLAATATISTHRGDLLGSRLPSRTMAAAAAAGAAVTATPPSMESRRREEADLDHRQRAATSHSQVPVAVAHRAVRGRTQLRQ